MGLMEMLPDPAYHNERHVQVLQDALGGQVRMLQRARDDLLLQVRPSTASWAMSKYEADYGISTDLTKTIGDRLAAWRAKRRGRGTATKAMIQSVAESFSVGAVRVIEHNEDYWFEVELTFRPGIKAQALIEVIEEIKPAHLEFLLRSTYIQQTAPARPIIAAASVTTVYHTHRGG